MPTSFENPPQPEHNKEKERRLLRVLTMLDDAITAQLRAVDVEDVSSLSFDAYHAGHLLPESRIVAHGSLAHLQESIAAYFSASAFSVKNRLFGARKVDDVQQDMALAQKIQAATEAACKQLADRAYTRFHSDMVAQASDYGLANAAEEYFTWRIEQSTHPLVFTMEHDGEHDDMVMRAPDFYTDDVIAQFHAENILQTA